MRQVSLLTACLALACLGAWAQMPQDNAPLDPKAGDFLDVDVEALVRTATDLYNKGEYEGAARGYLAALRYNVRDGNSIYNLACCYGLLGNAELAAKYLDRAVKAGFTDVEHIKNDPDFEKVRKDEAFSKLISELDERVKAMEPGGERIEIEGSAFRECFVHLPDGYDKAKTYPLVVALHGFGDNARNFSGLWRHFEGEGVIFAVPEAHYPFSVGNRVGYSWAPMGGVGPETEDEAGKRTGEYVLRVVEELRGRYSVSDVYLMGFSQGCGAAFVIGLKHPDRFKGLICFGGWLERDLLTLGEMDRAKDLRVFIAHGKDDRIVPIDSSKSALETLTKNGNDAILHDFDGGHQVPGEAIKAALAWLRG